MILVVQSLAGTTSAETVELHNGDIIHGKVLSLDAQVLKFQSESFGVLNKSASRLRRFTLLIER